MTTFEKTDRNRVRRAPQRGAYDAETIYTIIDAALFCHVGLVQDEQPVVIPTLHARRGDELLLHGAATSRLLQHVQAGHPVSVAITLLDGVVLARSVFHHSINYRSVVLFGTGRLVDADDEKMAALEQFTERIMPGRWADARQPNAQELKATAVVAVPIESASAKVRMGPPKDDEDDYQLPIWAGVIPITQQVGAPQPDPKLHDGIPLPPYVCEYVERRSGRRTTNDE